MNILSLIKVKMLVLFSNDHEHFMLVLLSNGHLYLSGVWLVVDLRTSSKKASCVTRDWTTCSEFVNHSRLNRLHHWGGGGSVYDY